MIHLGEYLAPARVIDLASRTKETALREMVDTLRGVPEVPDADAVLEAVTARENVLSTGIGLGVAVPHAKLVGVTEFVLAYGRSRDGIDFGSIDGRPVHHIVLIVGPQERQPRYLQFLASVMNAMKKSDFRRDLEHAAAPADLHRILAAAS
ncbi:MAG: PTS sugar transporter subunit IIA [Planctomycetes bacterium]|nr:PTS sugar transporter subunit IIA [Planctomycetota bacterium]